MNRYRRLARHHTSSAGMFGGMAVMAFIAMVSFAIHQSPFLAIASSSVGVITGWRSFRHLMKANLWHNRDIATRNQNL